MSLDKSMIPTVNILGINIAAINMDWLLDFTKKNIQALSGDYMCVANVHTTVTASEDDDYKKIQNSSAITIPDGGPLSTVGRMRGFKEMARTCGPDYMEEVFKISVENGWKHYFYGSTEDTLEKMAVNLKALYPGIDIVGTCSPPFRELIDDEDAEIINTINAVNTDFVWIGLGAPKQEKWMYLHKGKLKGLMVGVGAGFDYFAGKLQRAPKWVQQNNLEWFYRLLQEPRRLFQRYWYTNIRFIWRAGVRKL